MVCILRKLGSFCTRATTYLIFVFVIVLVFFFDRSNDRKIEELDLALYSDASDSLETQTSDMLQSVIVRNQCNPEIAHYTIRLGEQLSRLRLSTSVYSSMCCE